MSANTSIEWTDRTWNPVRGCSVISPGCTNCYAMKQAHRFARRRVETGMGSERRPGPFFGLTKQTKAGPQWTGVVRTVEDALREPLMWRKPQRIFVNSMSDLFHEGVPDVFIDRMFAIMHLSERHTFQVLTKRPERMHAYMTSRAKCDDGHVAIWTEQGPVESGGVAEGFKYRVPWPPPNVWLGVSAEDQPRLDARMPWLLDTPAAQRFLSCEPLLNGLDIAKHRPGANRLWVIVGGESGPGARPCHAWWIDNIVSQCQYAGAPVFVKQVGSVPLVKASRLRHWEWRDIQRPEDKRFTEHEPGVWRVHLADRKGGDMSEWPEELRVRQFPDVSGERHMTLRNDPVVGSGRGLR